MSRLYKDDPRLGAAHLNMTITKVTKIKMTMVMMTTMIVVMKITAMIILPNFNVLAVVTIASAGEGEFPRELALH